MTLVGSIGRTVAAMAALVTVAHAQDVNDLTRFNEAIDQSLAKSVSSYTTRIDQARDLFLAILSTMMLPIEVIIVPTFLIVKDLGWLNT